jgi:hypothetical protein
MRVDRAIKNLVVQNIVFIGITFYYMNIATADEVFIVRCVDYQVPIIMYPSNKVLGFTPKKGAFDIYIMPNSKIGWFQRIMPPFLSRERPARLEVQPLQYQISTSTREHFRDSEFITNEWVIIDRVAGTVEHYSQSPNMPHEPAYIHKRGGICSKIEVKF